MRNFSCVIHIEIVLGLACMQLHKNIHKTYILAYTYIHACTHTHIHACINIQCTHACTHTHTHTHTRACTHTHIVEMSDNLLIQTYVW